MNNAEKIFYKRNVFNPILREILRVAEQHKVKVTILNVISEGTGIIPGKLYINR
jgi:hypothetical protein